MVVGCFSDIVKGIIKKAGENDDAVTLND